MQYKKNNKNLLFFLSAQYSLCIYFSNELIPFYVFKAAQKESDRVVLCLCAVLSQRRLIPNWIEIFVQIPFDISERAWIRIFTFVHSHSPIPRCGFWCFRVANDETFISQIISLFSTIFVGNFVYESDFRKCNAIILDSWELITIFISLFWTYFFVKISKFDILLILAAVNAFVQRDITNLTSIYCHAVWWRDVQMLFEFDDFAQDFLQIFLNYSRTIFRGSQLPNWLQLSIPC